MKQSNKTNELVTLSSTGGITINKTNNNKTLTTGLYYNYKEKINLGFTYVEDNH